MIQFLRHKINVIIMLTKRSRITYFAIALPENVLSFEIFWPFSTIRDGGIKSVLHVIPLSTGICSMDLGWSFYMQQIPCWFLHTFSFPPSLCAPGKLILGGCIQGFPCSVFLFDSINGSNWRKTAGWEKGMVRFTASLPPRHADWFPLRATLYSDHCSLTFLLQALGW